MKLTGLGKIECNKWPTEQATVFSIKRRTYAACLVLVVISTSARSYDVNEMLSISGVVAGTGQCESVSGPPGLSNHCRGAMPIQPEISIRPTDFDEFALKFGFAVGNGLNGVTPFTLAPWAADLEDDVRNINGRNRDYLLTAWYRHEFTFAEDHALGVSIGLIDATDYLDENAYANDEFTQFMNETLTNAANVFLPSYDAGGAMEWDIGQWSVRGVVMNVGENDDGNNVNFVGLQLGYRLETRLGNGNYRVLVDGTSKAFLDPTGARLERRAAILLSLDQELGEILGVFIRMGWQDDKAAVNYEAIYSGGLDIKGSPWARSEDNIGIGFAYLHGGNKEVERTFVAETYYRASINEYFAVTADLQYQKDDVSTGIDLDGFIFGIRLAAEF